RFLLETFEAHPAQALQNQVGCSVAATDASSNESNRGDVKKILRRVPFRAARLDQCDAEHAITLKRVLEHVAVARFEDVKRQQRVRKQDCAGQRHHRDFAWQIYSPVFFHLRTISTGQTLNATVDPRPSWR